MSSDARRSWMLSEDAVLNWLSAGSRTYNWQALVALDRAKANDLLMQEYIRRYAADLYFAPITDTVEISDTDPLVWEHLYNHILGPPRLSFENSGNADWARLTLPILGGTQLTVVKIGGGPKHLTGISWYDPLQAPRLVCEIRLEDVGGEVTYDGKVYLDLKRGMNFRLTFASTYQDQRAGGEFYQELFLRLPPDKRRLLIGPLDAEGGATLEPDKFRLRALSARPARVGEKEGSSEGALLVFIGTKGNDVGQIPDKDEEWVYPIPAGRSVTTLVSVDTVFRLLDAQIRVLATTDGQEHDYIRDGKDIIGIRYIRGFHFTGRKEVWFSPASKTLRFSAGIGFATGPSGRDAVVCTTTLRNERIVMSWEYRSSPDEMPMLNGVEVEMAEGFVPVMSAVFSWNAEAEFEFVSDDDGDVKLVTASDVVVHNELQAATAYWLTYQPHLQAAEADAERFLAEELRQYMVSVCGGALESGLFRVCGLLFSGAQPVVHRSVRVPFDVAVFSDISPTQTAWQLSPVEKDIIHGGSVQFSVTPPQDGLTWNVETVPGFQGALGTVTQKGAYRAPTAAQIPSGQAYTMVRVTATKGSRSSSALVRVIRRSIVVNPLVVSANKDSRKVRLSGGSLVGGKLTWKVESVSGATLTHVSPGGDDLAEFDEGDMFYVPGKGSSGKALSVDTITATDSAGHHAISHVVMLEGVISGTVVIMEGADLPEGKIKLGLMLGGDEPVPDEDVTWEVLAGGGSVDKNGVYTTDTASDWAYTVIAGSFEVPPHVQLSGYLILPMPLLDLDEVRRALT